MVLNVVYAYLAEQADTADSAAVPAYQMGGVEEKDIVKASRRAALDEWLNAPLGQDAAHEEAVLAFLTS